MLMYECLKRENLVNLFLVKPMTKCIWKKGNRQREEKNACGHLPVSSTHNLNLQFFTFIQQMTPEKLVSFPQYNTWQRGKIQTIFWINRTDIERRRYRDVVLVGISIHMNIYNKHHHYENEKSWWIDPDRQTDRHTLATYLRSGCGRNKTKLTFP